MRALFLGDGRAGPAWRVVCSGARAAQCAWSVWGHASLRLSAHTAESYAEMASAAGCCVLIPS